MKTITITGLDGTGKTTYAKFLQSKLPNSSIVSVWDIIINPEYKVWSIYQYPPNVEQYVMNLTPASRSLFIFHAFNEAYQRAMQSQADYLIFDSHWYKYWAIEQAMGAPKQLGQFLSTQYKHSDITFCLELSIEEVLQRKKTISLYESGNKNKVDVNNFIKIQQSAQKIIRDILPDDTLYIYTAENIESIQQMIWNQIQKQFNL